MKNIAVIGTGYVGLVSGTTFAEVGNKVICCDIDQNKIDLLNNGMVPIYEPGLKELIQKNVQEERLSFSTNIYEAIKESEIIYICVGTPMAKSGEADLTYIKSAARLVGENLNGYKVIVNKSTVPVGTGKLVESIIKEKNVDNYPFDVISNPEFLREGSAIKDTLNMERAIIGASNPVAAEIITELHKPFNTEILITNIETAEMIKYASNAFLATKISFINSIANVCEKVGADVTSVAKGMGFDSRIGNKFLQAGIGYGGSCFPKDTQALVHIAEEVGYDFQLLKAVINVNIQQPFLMIRKIKDIFGDVKGKTVSVLGLSFKPNTDDMRDAPSLTIIPELIRMGAKIKAYDPIAIKNAEQYFNEYREYNIQYHDRLYETIKSSDFVLILTEWDEIKNMDLLKVKQLLKHPIIIDGRNCFEPEIMLQHDFIYHSIGRKAVEKNSFEYIPS